MSDLSGVPQDRTPGGAGAVLLTATGLAAAFGVASCCGLPFLLATAGLGTAWLGGVALLAAPHRTLLLVTAAACFSAAVGLLWRQWRSGVCTPGAICAHPAMRGLTLVGLLVGLALLYIGYTYG